MEKFKIGAKVTITNIMGVAEDTTVEPQYRVVGQTGYVREVTEDGWVFVLIPTHLYYSKGRGAALRGDEVDLLEDAHPLVKEHIKS
jgi:hypothetical protein